MIGWIKPVVHIKVEMLADESYRASITFDELIKLLETFTVCFDKIEVTDEHAFYCFGAVTEAYREGIRINVFTNTEYISFDDVDDNGYLIGGGEA